MINAERILRELDRHLDHEKVLILYGRAAIALGFPTAPDSVRQSLDVDALIPEEAVRSFQEDAAFWDAQEATNAALKKDGLYITHLFEAQGVFLRGRWEMQLVPIPVSGLQHLRLFRPATIDLVLTKMMRGDDAQDLADARFLIEHDGITRPQLEQAFREMQPIELAELRDAFERARPLVLALAHA